MKLDKTPSHSKEAMIDPSFCLFYSSEPR